MSLQLRKNKKVNPKLEEEGIKAKRQSSRIVVKKVVKFLFSHIGLCGMVIGYAVAGGFIFEHLERTNEKTECQREMDDYYLAENDTMYTLYEIGQSYPIPADEKLALMEYQLLLEKFRTIVLQLNYDGRNCTIMGEPGGPPYTWSYPGALLFSVTVITTIGYGTLAPKTQWGRLVCMAYAVIGVPLLLLFLANVGDVMADFFRYVYMNICCCGCFRRLHHYRKMRKTHHMRMGLPMGAGRTRDEAWRTRHRHSISVANRSSSIIEDSDSEDTDDDEERITVPLTIIMGVILGYILIGGAIFGAWENWGLVQSVYYCFITIATIGFGDVVPGAAKFQSSSDQLKMIFVAFYSVFGMAILSMSFSLVQEQIAGKFRWLGMKLGFIEKQDVDDDDIEMESKNK